MRRCAPFVVYLTVVCALACSDEADVVKSLGPQSHSDSGAINLRPADYGDDVADAPGQLRGLSAIGTDCEDSVVCEGGLCVATDRGGVCSGQCLGTDCESRCREDCPAGFVCVSSGEGAWVCVPTHGALCRSCETDLDCLEVTGLARCMDYPGGLAFCGGFCADNAPCPLGYVCQQYAGGAQCVLSEGVCDAPDPDPEPAPDPDPDPDPGPGSGPTSVCYAGPNSTYDVCFPLSPKGDISDAGYTWPSLSGAPDPVMYAPPTHLLDLKGVPPDTLLAKDFALGEFMQKWKGRWAVFSPKVVAHLQAIRSVLGVPLYVNSGFRSPGYNAPLPGAATYSRHMYGDAVDITAQGATSLEDVAFACKNEGAYFTKLYTDHVHCDWRTEPHDPNFWLAGAAKPGGAANWLMDVSAHVDHPAAVPAPGELVRLRAEWSGFDEGTPWVRWQVDGPEGTFVVEPSPELSFVPIRVGTYRIHWTVGGVVKGVMELPCH